MNGRALKNGGPQGLEFKERNGHQIVKDEGCRYIRSDCDTWKYG